MHLVSKTSAASYNSVYVTICLLFGLLFMYQFFQTGCLDDEFPKCARDTAAAVDNSSSDSLLL